MVSFVAISLLANVSNISMTQDTLVLNNLNVEKDWTLLWIQEMWKYIYIFFFTAKSGLIQS